ncbi:MAG: sigma-70 family RNA polymerase sigma factor [Holosporales bacterium]|jgi:RNA polymerase sigma-32 factor|nr:sigma-70 family RNA polymerase sigma factor [Holosporales bacterium]
MNYPSLLLARSKYAPNLSHEEEEQAFDNWHKYGSQHDLEKILVSYLKLVQKVLRKRRYWLVNEYEEDAFSEGVLGLLNAIKRFDPSKGIKLATYAVYWIDAFISKYIKVTASVVRRASTNERHSHSSPCFDAPIGQGDTFTRDVSIDALTKSNHSLLDNLLAPQDSPDDRVIEQSALMQKRKMLAEALGKLKDIERKVLRARYGGEDVRTFASIADDLGISPEGARRIEMRAIKKLQKIVWVARVSGSGGAVNN